jgi:hypothetical protein
MFVLYFLSYVVVCILIGLIGRGLVLGFIGLFLISFFLSPPVGIVLIVIMYAQSLAQKGTSR